MLSILQDVECTAHYITQSIIDVDGNSASAESYCIASSFGMPTAEGEKVNLAIGARYLDRLERINGEWKIIHRRVVFDWNSIMAGDCRWGLVPHDNSIKGARGSDDPLFHAQSEETL